MRSLEQDSGGIRTVQGLISGNGVATTGTGYVVTRTGLGAYSVRFTPPFRYFLSAEMSLTVGGFSVITWSSPTSDVLLFYTYNTGAAAADIGFLFMVRGVAR